MGEQFEALHNKFNGTSAPCKALLLSTFAKQLNLYNDELGRPIRSVFQAHLSSIDTEIQQRANEYLQMANLPDKQLMVPLNFSLLLHRVLSKLTRWLTESTQQTVLDAMPAFAEAEDDKSDGDEPAQHQADQDSELDEEESSSETLLT